MRSPPERDPHRPGYGAGTNPEASAAEPAGGRDTGVVPDPARRGDAPDPFGIDPGRGPQNPLDEWWMRRFPPYSRARLAFLLVAIVPIAILSELWWSRETGFSLARLLFAIIAGGGMLIFVFSRPPKPGSVLGGRAPAEPRPGEGPEAASVGDAGSAPGAPERPTARPRRGHLIAIGALVVGMVAFTLASGGFRDGAGTPILGSLVGGLLVWAIIALRKTYWSVVIFSLLLGAGASFALGLFGAMWGVENSFVGMWAVSSAMIAAVSTPFWIWMRRAEREVERATGHRLDTKTIAIGAAGMITLLVVLLALTGEL